MQARSPEIDHMNSVPETAPRRNNVVTYRALMDQDIATFVQIGVPAARLLQRLTRRPPETCVAIALLAGFAEVEEA